jgi:hypothetical protein
MSKVRLVECQFLIPLRRDGELSDGATHTTRTWRWLERELQDQFGGWSKASETYEGVWKSSMSDQLIRDRSVRYLVAVRTTQLEELRLILQAACARFAQQCIYLSIGGIVEFVEAST